LSKKLVIIPTFNEVENIASIIDAVLQLEESFDVLIVDDNSTDGTRKLVIDQQINYPNRVHLLERERKMGLGTAYIAGFKFGLKKGYDYLFEMDADFSHDPKDLPRLLKACEVYGADLTVGSRYVKGGSILNWSIDRHILSRMASIYVRLLTWMPISDPTAGFICYHRTVLESLPLNDIRFIGYAFQIEMKFAAWKQGFKLYEVPIVFKDREQGNSKMNGSIIKEAVFGVFQLIFRGFKGYYNKIN
jgi:dolichol-phosphate mannosyltransferase